MIGKLKGVVDEIGEDYCVIDVHGVGYVAYCPMKTLSALPGAGEAAVLFIETYVREDLIRLYGFSTALEREWFRLLQNNVQGVGAKVALAVLSTLSPAELANAIALFAATHAAQTKSNCRPERMIVSSHVNTIQPQFRQQCPPTWRRYLAGIDVREVRLIN
jgi:Holliday junction resolvasome RuvABC DNA-binding subunit